MHLHYFSLFRNILFVKCQSVVLCLKLVKARNGFIKDLHTLSPEFSFDTLAFKKRMFCVMCMCVF